MKQRSTKQATRDFRKIVVADACPEEYLCKDRSNYEVLRRARVRLDATCLLLFRMYWRTLQHESIWIGIFCDASPQFRGVELFASSFDMFNYESGEEFFERRKFTQISISRALYTVLGKTTAILWQIFLQVEPKFASMRAFCNRVCGITTDMGTERHIADYADILIPFCMAIGVRIPKGIQRQRYLFPCALMTMGWFHLFDNLLRNGLCNLAWFGAFLTVLKALTKFLRENRAEISQAYADAGMAGSASFFKTLAVASFAVWRWETLGVVCIDVWAPLTMLRDSFHLLQPLLKQMKDTTIAKKVIVALTSVQWLCEFKFVNWYSTSINSFASFGQSCMCHQEEYRKGIKVECSEKGRILPIAFTVTRNFLNKFLATAEGWSPTQWGGSRSFFDSCVGCVRGTWNRGCQKTEWMDEVPFILVVFSPPPDSILIHVDMYPVCP